MNDENTTVATVEAPIVADSSPVETATVEAPVKSKRQRKAERKAKLADKAGKPSKGRKGKATGESKPRVEPTVRDAFGNRVGTSSAAINATILASRVPLTVNEIHERTGAAGRATKGATRQHCLWLLERGHIKLKDGGYVKNVKAPRKPKAGKPAETTSEPTGDESNAD